MTEWQPSTTEYRRLRGTAPRSHDQIGRRRDTDVSVTPAIVVFRIGALGDTVVALPAIEHLRKSFPNHRLILLTDRHRTRTSYVSSWDVVERTGWIDDVVFYDVQSIAKERLATVVSLRRLMKRLRPERVICLSPYRSWLQKTRDYLLFRVVFGVPSVSGVFGERLERPRRTLPLARLEPEWNRLLRLAEDISGCPRSGEFRFPVTASDRESARLVLEQHARGSGLFLVVGAGSKMSAKRWPPERFVEVIRLALSEFPGLVALFLGGPDEKDYCQAMCDKIGASTVNLAGKLSIAGSAAVLEQAHAYVGNDSGVMHLAGAVGTPCVAIFSARDFPGLWEPIGLGHQILRREPECAGCMLQDCVHDKQRCLTEISSAQVWEELRCVLRQVQPQSASVFNLLADAVGPANRNIVGNCGHAA
jgi:heptosyltransferase III